MPEAAALVGDFVSKSQRYPAESRELQDAASGRRIRQITSHPSIHHHPFFFVPAYDQAMKKLIFVSYRTGKPQIFFEDRPAANWCRRRTATTSPIGRSSRRTTAAMSISPPAPSGWRVNLDTFEEEQLADFGAVEMREKGMVGAAMGTTALSKSGRWWAVPVKTGAVTRFVLIDTEKKTSSVFLERDTIGHPQFCPDDDDLILYAGPLTDRVWLTDRSGAKNRRLYQREDKMQWVTHEVWVPGRRTVAFVDWPRGMRMIDVDRGVVRRSRAFRPGTRRRTTPASVLSATPIFPIAACISSTSTAIRPTRPKPLCASEASSEGKHWGGPFPYNDGPVAVEAAQHTHPHPRFSPDGSRVVFTSDKTGHAQLYEVI